MSTTFRRSLAMALAVAFLATTAVAGTTVAQPSEDPPSAEFDGELHSTNGNGQRVTGTTTLDAGTEIIVEIRENDESRDVERATVGEDGSFSAEFDLQGWEPGTEYTAVVLLQEENSGPWVRINDGVTGTITEAPTISFTNGDDTLLASNATERTISGETSLDPGSEVSIQIESDEDSDDPFLMTGTATVSEDGTFRATFDLSAVPAGTRFRVTARAPGAESTGTHGRVVDEMPTGTTTTVESTTETAETSNDSGQPGFGIAVALVALCGVALLARRD